MGESPFQTWKAWPFPAIPEVTAHDVRFRGGDSEKVKNIRLRYGAGFLNEMGISNGGI